MPWEEKSRARVIFASRKSQAGPRRGDACFDGLEYGPFSAAVVLRGVGARLGRGDSAAQNPRSALNDLQMADARVSDVGGRRARPGDRSVAKDPVVGRPHGRWEPPRVLRQFSASFVLINVEVGGNFIRFRVVRAR